jgi:hypothetical protein
MMIVLDISSVLMLFERSQRFRTPILRQSSGRSMISTVLGLLDGATIYRGLAKSVLTARTKGLHMFQQFRSYSQIVGIKKGDMQQVPY